MLAPAWWSFTVLVFAVVVRSAHAATFIEGEALYRERILPPPDATLIVTLEAVALADARSTEIASTRRLVVVGPPYHWRIDYDTARVGLTQRLALRARILTPEGLWMTTNTFVPMPTDPAMAPNLLLVQTAKPMAAPTEAQAGPTGAACTTAITQADATRCAHEDFLAASQIYAERYAVLAANLSAAQRKRLQQMQKNWIGYRTAACQFESGAAQGVARCSHK